MREIPLVHTPEIIEASSFGLKDHAASEFCLYISTYYQNMVLYMALCLVGWWIWKFVNNVVNSRRRKHTMHIRATQKRKCLEQFHNQNELPDVGLTSSLEQLILNSDVTTLIKLLDENQITSAQILIAYYKRASTIGVKLELVTESNFGEALKLAKECDRIRKENPKEKKGSLFGIPVSIKDCIDQKGFDSTLGLASRCFNPLPEDGLLIQLLKSHGAIPFIRSNVPQNLLLLEAINNIFGRSKNPWNQDRSTGGSSGGEAGLISSKCSPLGLANDSGGSIRIPALWCGVYGFKPTLGRIINHGLAELVKISKGEIILPVAGPIGKSTNDLNLMMKCFLDDKLLKEKAEGIPEYHYYAHREWKEHLIFQNDKLRIGYTTSNSFIEASDADKRAIKEAIQALQAKGHTLIEVNFPLIHEAFFWMLKSLSSGGINMVFDAMNGEEVVDEMKPNQVSSRIPNWIKMIMVKILKVIKQERLADILESTRKLDTLELKLLNSRLIEIRQEFIKLWKEIYNIDALILPGALTCALKHGYGKDLFINAIQSIFCNVINLPAGVVPITIVNEDEQGYIKGLKGKSSDLLVQKLMENMKGSVGLPVGVQVCTLPFEDEKCLNIMRQLEEEIQFQKKFQPPSL